MHYILFYEVVEDYAEKRKEHRYEHLKLAKKAYERGELLLAGAFADPIDGAALIFTGSSPEVAENFVKSDPYVLNGLVKSWKIRKWTTVIGEDAMACNLTQEHIH